MKSKIFLDALSKSGAHWDGKQEFFYMALLSGKYKNIPVTVHAILMIPDGAKTMQPIFIKLLHLKYCSRGSQIVEG